ncbi:hypothetical protein F4604DRAFT_1691456 [Suillus subluteus]|nr:hypothetical protein F4604DRAFT_1691456 [Suillus subluteus]
MIKVQPLPIAPSVIQIYGAATQSANQPQAQQASPTTANIPPQSKRTSSPPALTQAVPDVTKLPSPLNQPSHLREEAIQGHYSPSAAHLMNPQMSYPRPINRVPPQQFLTHFCTMEENWDMTEELMAEIERADHAQALSQQPAVPGMSGVASTSGAASGAVNVREVPSPLKDPVGDRVRANERSSPNHDDALAAYISHYFQSPRPVVPISLTPHTTPSPLISGMQSMQASSAPPVGSPHPSPFSHVRRNNFYSTYPTHTAPTSNYDPNYPSVFEEQLALQMQMYALNKHTALSDSTFSPSSTPFPGPGYNPWMFLQASLEPEPPTSQPSVPD